MNWTSLLGIFAKPLGAAINNALSAGSAAVIAWSVTKVGSDATSSWVVPAVASATLALSQAISGFAATQGVQIPIINKDQTNGVKVVPVTTPGQPVDAPLK